MTCSMSCTKQVHTDCSASGDVRESQECHMQLEDIPCMTFATLEHRLLFTFATHV